MKILVIGYGNQSRRDDGAGWLVIERLAALGLPDVELQTAHQLSVDVAETVSRFDVVIFVDAAVADSPHAVTRTVVQPSLESHVTAHSLAPADVLALCRTLYGKEPQGILFSIRGHSFDFGMELTPEVEQAAHEVVKQIIQIVQNPHPAPLPYTARARGNNLEENPHPDPLPYTARARGKNLEENPRPLPCAAQEREIFSPTLCVGENKSEGTS